MDRIFCSRFFDLFFYYVDEFTVANDIDGWDSLMHIAVISTIENEFNVDFSMNEVVGFKNIGDIVRLIYEKTNL